MTFSSPSVLQMHGPASASWQSALILHAMELSKAHATGRHTAPIFAGDTVFASTEIREVRDFPDRPDLALVSTTLRGHKFVRKDGNAERVDIFYLERELAVKRRSHYA